MSLTLRLQLLPGPILLLPLSCFGFENPSPGALPVQITKQRKMSRRLLLTHRHEQCKDFQWAGEKYFRRGRGLYLEANNIGEWPKPLRKSASGGGKREGKLKIDL